MRQTGFPRNWRVALGWSHGVRRSPRQRQGDQLLAFAGAVALATTWLLGCSGRVQEEPLSLDDVASRVSAAPAAGQLPDTSVPVSDEAESWCQADPALEVGRIPAQAQDLTGVTLNQGVEVVLSGERGVDVVAGRDALVRVFVDPSTGPLHGASLRVESEEHGIHSFVDERPLRSTSSPGVLTSTYHFLLSGELITPTTKISARVFRVDDCSRSDSSEARFPQSGALALDARQVGGLKIVAIPVIYRADGSDRAPNVTGAELESMRAHLEALVPVSHVEWSVHDEVVSREPDLEGMLAELMHLRSIERPPSQTIYFGFVRPAESMNEYCQGTCVAGISAVGSASGHGSTGIGVAFESTRAETFVHEVGHILRLDHAPCGGPSGVDPEFPHEDARVGGWGFDLRTARLVDPGGSARDFMSYCDPTWISDHNYQKLLDRIAFANGQLWSDVVRWEGTTQPAQRPEHQLQGGNPTVGVSPGGPRNEEAVEFVSCLHHAEE